MDDKYSRLFRALMSLFHLAQEYDGGPEVVMSREAQIALAIGVKRLEDNIKMLEGAIEGWRRTNAALEAKLKARRAGG